MTRLAGKVAIITGGANGIGRESALRFAREGACVVIGDVHDANAQSVLSDAENEGHGDRVRFRHTDVSREADVRELLDYAVSELGRLDCVFNNAGIGGVFGPISQTRLEDWDESLSVLLRGVFLGMKHAARRLVAQGEGGVILSTSSVAGLGGGVGAHCYSAAKAAILSLTRTVACELASRRIRVNAIAPGPVLTDLFLDGDREAGEKLMGEKQPWPEPGSARDIAAVAAFLASDDARFITGETVVVDGGLRAQGPAVFGTGSADRLLKRSGVDWGSTGVGRVFRPSEQTQGEGRTATEGREGDRRC